jgi:hypothetical protein
MSFGYRLQGGNSACSDHKLRWLILFTELQPYQTVILDSHGWLWYNNIFKYDVNELIVII